MSFGLGCFPTLRSYGRSISCVHAMLPYLYSASAAATTSGVLPMHPLYYDWPGEEQAYMFSAWSMSVAVSPGNSTSSCLTAPKAGMGADDGQAGKPRSCVPGIRWCNGFQTANASMCAAACCAIKPTGASTMTCGGYTFDPKQADTSGGTRCPVGSPCCWLKQAPSALGKAPSRYIGATRASALPKQLQVKSLEYSWGRDMVVAPIFAPTVNGSVSHSVWIPPGGAGWIRWQTGELFLGPRVMMHNFTQQEIPVFVRAGAVIPMKTMEAVHDVAPAVLVLHVVLPLVSASSASYAGNTTIHEDDGTTMGYQSTGAFRTMDVAQTSNSSGTHVHIAPHSGGNGYAGEPTQRWYNIEVLCAKEPSKVTVNGVAVPAGTTADAKARGWWRSSFGPNKVPTLVVGTGVLGATVPVAVGIVV